MKKDTVFELSFVGIIGLASLIAFLFCYRSPNLDEKTSWANVLVGKEEPKREDGKYHYYYVNYSNWKTYRKERGVWKEKGYIFELSNTKTSKKEYSNIQEIYSYYKVVVKMNLSYDYVGSGAEWLVDLCQLRLYERPIYNVKFVNYDGSLIWETKSYLRQSISFNGSTPVRAGYTFDGWDSKFDNVCSDLVIKATYK